jgi:uncharacterized low-complexity protein
MKRNSIRPLATVIGASVLASAVSAAAQAGNPFQLTDMAQGYQVAAEEHQAAEGKCGEGKCGEQKAEGEGKCGEGKCGEKKAAGEGKCGEGKCGEKKPDAGTV